MSHGELSRLRVDNVNVHAKKRGGGGGGGGGLMVGGMAPRLPLVP